MIVYSATKHQFLHHVSHDDIERVIGRHYEHATGGRVGPSEVAAWKNSLSEMAKVLQDEEIPKDAGVAIEYRLPQSSMRIDFLVTGEDSLRRQTVLIVELKQWSDSRRSEKDAIVWARRGGRAEEREGTHPSYQAWSYAAYLQDFNEAVESGEIALQPCAYLHNHPRNGEIDHAHYGEHIARAPLFLARERAKLQAFIRAHVRFGDGGQTLYALEHGRIRPSKMLSDHVTGLLQGSSEFVLIDDQKVVYETVLKASDDAMDSKQVLIIRGGPGTGKSVVAVNLLGALIGRGRNARYVSKNAAPRAVYEAKLTRTFKKSRISNLFQGSGAYVETAPDTFDVLIVDEAHRLNEKSGLYRNQGDNQIRELIRAAKCSAFFIDEDQRVTVYDIGRTDAIRQFAAEEGARIVELELASQFRCNGSNGYLAWLDNTLDVRETANQLLPVDEYDFRVIDSPQELHELIEIKNRANNRARVVAGYCWKWPSKNDPSAWDIEFPEFEYRRRWNLDKDGSLWIVTPGSVEQVGCIHTCQGLELDYVGVIVGPDLFCREGKVVTDVAKRASSDQSVFGMKKMLRERPDEARALADTIIKNTYRTLMTRGMKGCYVYCTDPTLADYFRSRLSAPSWAVPVADPLSTTPGLGSSVHPLRLVSPEERDSGVRAAPVVDLRFAAGTFSGVQSPGVAATEWVAIPDWVSPQPGLFVAQVFGESMNRRIPNGAWCLFRANPQGTREGKVTVVQHHSISDPETGGKYTVKVYGSEKVVDATGQWRHAKVILKPDSNLPGYSPIILEPDVEGEVTVVAEFLMTLPWES